MISIALVFIFLGVLMVKETSKNKNDIYYRIKNILGSVYVYIVKLFNNIFKKQNTDNIEFKANEYYKPIHDICKKISKDVYNGFNPYQDFMGYKRFHAVEIEKSGFFGSAYINSQDKIVIIAYRGTEKSIVDIKNDVAMGIKDHIPAQFYDAEKFYREVQNKLDDKVTEYQIIFTGHSLGGSIAELMGAKYGNETVTFNAFGVGNIKNLEIIYTENIINYGNTDDFVYNAKGAKHIGLTIQISTNEQEKLNKGICLTKYHSIPNMGDLSQIPS